MIQNCNNDNNNNNNNNDNNNNNNNDNNDTNDDDNNMKNYNRKNRQHPKQRNNNHNHNEDLILSSSITSYNNPKTSPSYRTQITLNSLTTLIPILYKTFHHPQYKNYNLEMKNGPRIRKRESHYEHKKKKEIEKLTLPENIIYEPQQLEQRKGKHGHVKKSQCYLFFDHVYSITTVRAFEQCKREVEQLLSFVPSSCTVVMNHWLTNTHHQNMMLIWDKCTSNDEIIKKTFVLRNHSVNGKKEIEETKEDEVTKDIETFSKRVDAELIQPLVEFNKEIVSLQQATIVGLHEELLNTLSKRFQNVKLTVYGSCLSGLSLGRSSDVDVSLYLPEVYHLKTSLDNGRINVEAYDKKMKRLVYLVRDVLHHRCRSGLFNDVTAIPFARIPVVKGTCDLTKRHPPMFTNVHFDICFLNDIAVVNSNLLREYSLIDERVRMLMIAVKSWSKLNKVGNAAENTLSSYSWIILVIFYLQCIDFLPILQCPKFMKAHEEHFDKNNRLHFVNGLNTHFVTSLKVEQTGIWKVPDRFAETPVSVLLAGFFMFYAHHFPKHSVAVSIRLGKCVLQKSVFRSARLWRLCIEDPFETHDSHCPHDLGTPMNEEGQARVSQALADAANQMENMFTDCSIIDCIGTKYHLNQDEPNNKSVVENNHTNGGKDKGRNRKKKKNNQQKNTHTYQENISTTNQQQNTAVIDEIISKGGKLHEEEKVVNKHSKRKKNTPRRKKGINNSTGMPNKDQSDVNNNTQKTSTSKMMHKSGLSEMPKREQKDDNNNTQKIPTPEKKQKHLQSQMPNQDKKDDNSNTQKTSTSEKKQYNRNMRHRKRKDNEKKDTKLGTGT